jgi:hypothetical protein
MKKFNVSISTNNYATKPHKSEYSAMVFQQQEVDINELSDYISNGYAICHNFTNDTFSIKYKTYNNFTTTNLVVLDFDSSPLSFDETMGRIKIKPSIAFTTFSNSKEDFRFKLIYLFNDLITNKEDYKLKTEMIFKVIFEEEDLNIISSSFDSSCTSCTQLFLGTNSTQKVETSNTIITLDLLNNLLNINTIQWNDYNEIYEYLNLNSTNQNISNIKLKCPIREKNNKYIINNDFSILPFNGTPNNDIYKDSIYNNYQSALIDDSVRSNVYYYVGDQNIYYINTYFNGKRIPVGKRHQVMKYFTIVLRNMHPGIKVNELSNRVYWFIMQYCEKSYEINQQDVYRLCKSMTQMNNQTKVGKRKFILNPDYKHLSREEKMKELFKCKGENTLRLIEENYKKNLSLVENAKLLNYSTKTISKYIKSSTKEVNVIKRSNRFEEFLQLYNEQDDKDKSVREWSTLSGISKSQIQRYLTKLMIPR